MKSYDHVIRRKEYCEKRDIVEGDLVKLAYEDSQNIGIVLQVALEVRNEDHLGLSEEFLIAEIMIAGQIHVFDEDELIIVEKCNLLNFAV
jgi:hypothetical protein